MIRILIADDQALVRGALATLLDLEEDLEVVAQASSGPEAIAAAQDTEIDVALLDVEMPGGNGFAACETLAARGITVLMVTTFGRPGYVRRAFEAGAVGFVVKDAPAEELASRVRDAAAGKRVIDPELAVDSLAAGINPLTEREIEVAREALRGGTVDEIARALFLSRGTVRNHVSAILAKTGGRNRADGAAKARDNGWL
ncbi:MAG: response regulator transcription factor [Flaviflexus sp.]|nr:response regulator transcription factor [Flaviflexus sp.]